MTLHLDALISGLILIAAFYVVFFVGKWVNDLIHREYRLTHELFERDNPALAVAIVGYYGGLVLTIGGAMTGPSAGIWDDLIDLGIYGALGIVLLNVSWYVCDRLILIHFRLADELIRDQNVGSGAVSAGVSLGSGFILYGSIQGEGGGVLTALVFWALGQVLLVAAGHVYEWITPYNVRGEIEKDNVAAGVSYGGALLAMGVVVGLAAQNDFVSWRESLVDYLVFSVLGLALLPLVRYLTDLVLVPSVKLEDEIAGQEEPNLGAAFIEAFAYISAAFIIHWCL
jgi:uncharacterized membrane protein YjfL (UPF0719 family)